MPFSTYLPEHMGSIRLTPSGPFVAGSHAELTLVYTAGTFGIDDTGMVKVSWRTTSDMSKPQFDKPAAANFTTVEASNGAKLEVWFDRLNIRPYANTLLIRVGRGYLRAGDTLTDTSRRPPAGLARLPPADQCRRARRAQDLDRCLRDLRILRAARAALVRSGGWARRAGRRSGPRSRWPVSRFAWPSLPRTCGATRPRTPIKSSRSWRRGRCAACRSASQSSPATARVCWKISSSTLPAISSCGSWPAARRSPAPTRCAWSRPRRCGATGAICTARAARPSAWARRKAISATRAISRSSTWSATRATTSRSRMRSGRSSTG